VYQFSLISLLPLNNLTHSTLSVSLLLAPCKYIRTVLVSGTVTECVACESANWNWRVIVLFVDSVSCKD
jgi:hypothetical protein